MGDDFDWTNPEFWTDWDKNPSVTDYGWDDAMQDLAESGGLKPSDFAAPDFLQKAVDALKKLGGKAADFVSSPQGIMSLVGAAANYVDRQRPSGGGTTMAYQGPAELKRKMVQGPYGPVAEYEGVGGGAPDYTRFAAPTAREAAPAPRAPTGQTAQQKADLYKFMRDSIGMSDAQIRQFANYSYGDQKDSDWQELLRIVGENAPVTAPKTTAPIAAPGQKPAAGSGEQPLDHNKNYGIPFDMRYRGGEAGDEKGFTQIPTGDVAQNPIFQILESASPQAKAQEYNRLRNAGFTDAQIRKQAGSVFGPQSDEDWQYLLNIATPDASSSQNWYVGKDNKTPVLRSGRLGVSLDLRGQPEYINYYNEAGEKLSSSTFSAPDLLRNAQKYGINVNDALGLGQGLEFNKIGYQPGDLYRGSGSNLGINFEDLAAGGYGTAYDWTKDPLAAMKGPGALESLRANQELAQSLGLKRSDVTKSGGILSEKLAPTTSMKTGYRPFIVNRGGSAASFGTLAEAQKYASEFGGTVNDLSALPVINTDNPNARTGDIQGFLPPAQVASAAPATAQPATQPAAQRNLQSLLPSDWSSYTGVEGTQKKIDWFNQQKATQAELQAAGVKPEEIAWMRQNKLGTYAQGGPVRMEDGGFVMTKRAVDGAGGPRGIQQLVPGARMIRGPGHGTSDSIPAYIQGRNGRTPARLSNGEAYVPPGQDTSKLYDLMKSLERNA